MQRAIWAFMAVAFLSTMATAQALGGEGTPGGAGAKQLKYFLHYRGDDGAPCEPSKLGLSPEDGPDGHACGEIKPQPSTGYCFFVVCAPVEKVPPLMFPSGERFNHSVGNGYPASGQVWVRTKVPDAVSLYVSITVGTGWCSARAEERILTPDEWTPFDFECTFRVGTATTHHADKEGEQREKERPTTTAGGTEKATGSLDVQVMPMRQVNYFLGFEGEHASWVQLSADPPETPQNRSRDAAQPQSEPKDTPALTWMAPIALAIAFAVARRRRE